MPRLVLVPAWATPDGPWTAIRDGWPGSVEVLLGAGLGGVAADEPWALADDVARLAAVLRADDVLCGAGWAATTVLLGAQRVSPRLVALFSPPLGLDLRDLAVQVRGDQEASRELMASFGGSPDHWEMSVRAPNFLHRVDAYLTQDLLAASEGVAAPVVVVSPGVVGDHLPEGWLVRRGTAASFAGLVQDVIRPEAPDEDAC